MAIEFGKDLTFLDDLEFADLPRVVDIDPIHNCNLRCLSCHVPQEVLSHQELSLDAVARLGENPGAVAKVGTTHEPTSHSAFPEIVNLLNDFGMRIALTTNGTLLTSRKISAIRNPAVFENVTLSFDAATPALYEYLRKGAKFVPTLERIRNFISILDRSRTRVWVNYVLLRANLGDLERAIDLWEEMGVDGLSLIASSDRPDNLFLQDQMYQTNQPQFETAVARAAEHLVRAKGRMALISPLLNTPEIKARAGALLQNGALVSGHPEPRYLQPPQAIPTRCVAPSREVRVRWNGSVILCHNKFPIGNLNNESLASLWAGRRARHVRDMLRADPRHCQGCQYFHYCLTMKTDVDFDNGAVAPDVGPNIFNAPMVLLKDSGGLSEAEAAVALSLCQSIAALAGASETAVSPLTKGYRLLAGGNPRLIGRLRLFCAPLTGTGLLDASAAEIAPRQIAMIGKETLETGLDKLIAHNLEELRRHGLVFFWGRNTEGVPPRVIVSPPPRLGEVGYLVDGVIVNYDTVVCQERASLLYWSGVLDWLEHRRQQRSGTLRLLLLGGGYGALAHWLGGLYPEATLTLVDTPESLLFSGLYLALTRPELPRAFGVAPVTGGLRFIPDHQLSLLREPFDLVIDTRCAADRKRAPMSENVTLTMEPWLADAGLLFAQHHGDAASPNDPLDDNAPMGAGPSPLYCLALRGAPSCGVTFTQGAAHLWSREPQEVPRPTQLLAFKSTLLETHWTVVKATK